MYLFVDKQDKFLSAWAGTHKIINNSNPSFRFSFKFQTYKKKVFFTTYNFKMDKKKKTRKQFRQVWCGICFREFRQKQTLRDHIKSDHDGKKSFKCERCNFSALKRHQLRQHIDMVHETTDLFICEICFLDFKTKQILNIHKETVHKGYKPFKCELCDTVVFRFKHVQFKEVFSI